MKKTSTFIMLFAMVGLLSSAFSQNPQSGKYQKHTSFVNPVTNPLNLLSPKSTIYLMDSSYIWPYDSLTSTWNTSPEGKTVDFVYNSSNDLTSETDLQLSGSTWKNMALITYTYNSDNKVLSELWKYWNTSSWVNQMQYSFVYNSSNECTSDTVQIWMGSTWQYSLLYNNTFDASGNMTVELGKDWSGSAWANDVQYIFTYNTSNQCTSNLEKSWSGSAWVNYKQNAYTYNSNGDQISDIQQKWSGTTWVNYSNTIMYYNSNNLMTNSATRGWNSAATKINGGDSLCYYYKAVSGINELPAQEGNITVYPNPVTNNLTIDVPEKATINILNTQGQHIETLLINGNLTNVDVSNLPSGVYMMEVITEKGIEVKKLIKK
ncbi:MAG: T9SS type A sorting domain-containing protein [Bacteroidales bacterium]